MSKKRNKISSIDYQFGINEIIPATQEAFKDDGFNEKVRKEEKENLKNFKEKLSKELDTELKKQSQFPSNEGVFIFIVQYLISDKDYNNRDLDNMAKTILDVLKKRFYNDDGQVISLLVCKQKDYRIPINFAYVAIKELKGNKNIEILKMAGIERCINYYNEVKDKFN